MTARHGYIREKDNMSFLSENGLEILLGAAFIVFAMSASRFIVGVVRSRKNTLSAGTNYKPDTDKKNGGKKG